jgi:hydrogenase-4 component F
MPPSGLFVSEFMIFRALFEGKYFIMLTVVLILLTVVIFAFGKNIMKILFLPVPGLDETKIPRINPWESLTQYILLFIAMWLGLNPPSIFVELIQDAVKTLPK